MTRDGGPAFPRPHSTTEWGDYTDEDRPAQPGMSLRDYFAGQVLAGIVGRELEHYRDDDRELRELTDTLTEYAWLIADAMIEARGLDDPPSDVQPSLLNVDDEGL